MKQKIATFMFGLLLAVGWTNCAQAQLKAKDFNSVASHFALPEQDAVKASDDYQPGGRLHAPRRADNNYTTKVVHDKSWYEQSKFDYTWMDGNTPTPAKLTDVVTDPNQMWYLLKHIYTTADLPGPLYNKAYEAANTYPGFGYGWNFTGSMASTLTITTNNTNAYIFNVEITDMSGNSLASYTATNLYNNFSNVSRTTYSYNGSNYYAAYISGGGSMSFSVSSLGSAASDGVIVKITAVANSSSSTSRISVNGSAQTLEYGTPYIYNYTVSPTYDSAPTPTEDGYTVCLVKVKNNSEKAPNTTATYDDLVTIFNDYVESIEVLTDGLRVGENGTSTAGTVFSYTGILNKFFFISKGKLAKFGYLAPFYGMYEEFSPTTTAEGDEIDDFYVEMVGGNSYGIIHDCASVLYMDHAFSMSGNAGTEEKSLSSLVFYIPDERGRSPYDSIPEGATTPSTYHSRNYELRPQVGLYTIRLAAETAPVAGYSEENRMYDVFLDWSSSLNTMVNNEVPQTYIIYKVTFDDHGNRVYTYLDEVEDVTTYTYQEDQLQTSQTFTYVILGYPTNATNKPTVNAHGDIESGQFYTYSNLDDVQIPGWFDFMVLYRERYESDFVIPEEKNYYRNYLYPTNLTPGTGMTMGQLKQEWPNQTASYTLWRDNTGVAKLEVRAIGNKVYYRIRYYEGSQVTTTPNNIEMPYPYVEIPNENN